jgi:hypothetical protein
MAERNTKLVLDTQQMTDNFFDDTRLLGIMAPLKDYQLCWYFNNSLGFNFRLNSDYEIQLMKRKRRYFFSVFEYCEPDRHLSHYVYNNQFDGEYLLPELKHMDYLWLMKGEAVCDELLNETIQFIKSISQVQMVSELTNEKIRNKQHLFF